MQIINWFVFYFDYAYLIRLSDVTKPTKWPLPSQSICKYSNVHNFPVFQHIYLKLDKNAWFIELFLINIFIIRVAVPFKAKSNITLFST